MPFALCCMSHSPLLDLNQPSPDLQAEVTDALKRARTFVDEFAPELVVTFTPDHYNGFFYRLMPPFCIGAAARTVGDYGTAAGPLDVPRDIAAGCAEAALAAEVDVSVSYDMELDHATAQPLQILFGTLDACPVVPIFINAAAPPLGPVTRARRLGEAVGRFLAGRPERILLIGSGGLSHDPPVPALGTAPAPLAERLVSGRELTADEERRKVTGAIAEAAALAARSSSRIDLCPDWDRAFLGIVGSGGLDTIDGWSNEDIARHGSGAQEIRTWVAAYSALAATGPYEITDRYYHPIPEYIAGFAVTTALPATRSTGS
ncbi:3-carboxyethylcatechol 2,3-dioxygenase [Actinomadura sp. LD22]|uniref:2,3-dihydroxyphenylpropionate/2,3-dihydroxicinnamic acid 1,2-dioxygenase n=2 Tax=Actinomadura physcomitrii TaxID=2650748 RepID=A0A6I4MTT4_9ACTN|nr:3-carboxyethylcatechol 2,3-dioxygenase [Actinomadura physcomitrii]